ncbi:hypothetical protein Q2T40_17400 [Winogradskyella maritima]|uniref:Aspartyl protease n=1 Tax=Winogradskyella maritima TaxID=1517766 RepID=A0ABV8AEE8_9FLAO|nr:hypothetical protein [Winogradskyella maritima]
MKLLTVILFTILISDATFGQSMITENSYLENEDGKEISYAIFVTKMDSGRFTMIPLKDETKKVIGYRLEPLTSIKSVSKTTNNPKIEIGEIMELDVIYHKHIFILVTFNSESESKAGWMIFDTGTFVPIIITNEKFKAKLGAVKSVEVNGFEIKNPRTGTYGFPEVIQQYHETYTKEIGDFLGGKEIIGIMGYQLFKDYLVSIDLSKNKIYLRNPLTKEKSIITNKTYKVNYRDDLQNIWLPVTINNKEGLAHLDTGYPFTWIEESIVKNEVESFTIDGLDVFEKIDFKYKMAQQSQNYANLKFPLIANIGNDFLSHFVLTIDSVNKQLLFELIKD